MPLNSLRSSITAIATVAIVLVGVSVMWFSTSVYETLYSRAATEDLDGLSENLASDLIPLMAENDTFSIANLLLRLDQYDHVKYAAVLDLEKAEVQSYIGNTLTSASTESEIASIQFTQFSENINQPLGMHEGSGNIWALKRIGEADLPLGYLLIINDLSRPLQASKRELLYAVLPLLVITLILTALLMVALQNMILKPLTELANFMQRIKSSKNYSLVAEVKGKREIAALTEGFNSMMQAINEEVEKNKQHTQLVLKQQRQMEKLANFDTLTGLPNRQFFMENLRLELANSEQTTHDFALMFFDLDGFKLVNDSFGHEVGDKLLSCISMDLKGFMRRGDIVARLGGDEFLVLVRDDPSDDILAAIAERMIDGLSQTYEIDGWEVQVGISLGIARASDADYQMSVLVSNADIAMYRSKQNGRGQYTMFVNDMMEDNKRKNLIAASIAHAIENREFRLHYQPKVDASGSICGHEALLRWHSAELGNVSPAEFIPIAEQSGRVSKISQWVVRQVCHDMAEQASQNNIHCVSLNLSTHDLKDTQLAKAIEARRHEFHVDPNQLEFEITESAYLENLELANQFFQTIRELGCKIALDDFGTGYSSLGYLTKISIDTLKIDKQFVDHVGVSERSSLITRTIIEMAKQLNLTVCAEGVETQEQADFLIQAGCHQLQGYLYGKPEPLATSLENRATG